MIFRRKKPKPPVCLNCGRPRIEWPRFFSQAFYEEHRCPSGRGHNFTDRRLLR